MPKTRSARRPALLHLQASYWPVRGARRGVKSVRRRLADEDSGVDDARAEAEEAMKALVDIRKPNPDAVRQATDRKEAATSPASLSTARDGGRHGRRGVDHHG